MFGTGSKPSLGLSINTTASSGASLFGSASNQSTGSLFGSLGAGATSKPAEQGGSSGSATSSQPTQIGGLFGSSASQPLQSGGLFLSTTSQPTNLGGLGAAASQPAAGIGLGATTTGSTGSGLFGSTSSNPPQSSGLFGATTTESGSGSGLFRNPKPHPAPATGLFASSSQPSHGDGLLGKTATQAAPTGGLFGATTTPAPQGGGLGGTTTQPSQGLFGSSQAPQQSGLFGGLNQGNDDKPAGSLNLGQQSAYSAATSSTRIDLDHLRPTTKFDQLTEDLQKEILDLDTMILNEINRCGEVSNLLPTVAAAGAYIANDVAYVSERLEEIETGLENDAADIQSLKEGMLKTDVNEARVCFREVDRLKMPSQYQATVAGPATSITSGIYGGHGLSGWWNHPQTLQRSVRGGGGDGGGRTLQLLGGEDQNGVGGPANLVDFFDRRTEGMRDALVKNKTLLSQIEDFVTALEGKIEMKQQEVIAREEGRVDGVQVEDDVNLLRYVFGEFERSLYEVADKVGAARDGVRELVLGAPGPRGRL